MNKNTSKLDELLPTLLPVLEQWVITYKLIGSEDETPRYSQLMRKDGVFVLKSTQKNLFYELDLSPQQIAMLEFSDGNTVWQWWKEQRTKYLLENHPTLSVY